MCVSRISPDSKSFSWDFFSSRKGEVLAVETKTNTGVPCKFGAISGSGKWEGEAGLPDGLFRVTVCFSELLFALASALLAPYNC